MKKTLLLLALPLLLLFAAGQAPGEGRHVRAVLEPVGGSGVSGWVELTQQPRHSSNLVIVAHGLGADTTYAAYYYEASDCIGARNLFATFRGRPGGEGEVQGRIAADVDQVGSIAVRLGPDYGTLLACAKVR